MTAFVELIQATPELQKGVTQDIRFNLVVNGVKADVTTAATDISVVVIDDVTESTVTTGTPTKIDEGDYAVSIEGALLGTETALSTTINVTTTDGNSHVFEQSYDVVGSQLFSIYEIRDGGAGKLTAAKFSDEKVIRARALITEFFEYYCNTSFIRRYSTLTVDGSGTLDLDLPIHNLREVRTCSIDDTALSTASIAALEVYEHGLVYNESGWSLGRRNVDIGVVAGLDRAPWDIRSAAIEYARHVLSPGAVTDRAMIMTDETGTYRLSIAGSADRPTGFPAIDFVLNQYREPGVW